MPNDLLRQAIHWLTEGRKLRISVHDLTGVFHEEGPLLLATDHMIHQAPVCVLAKTAMNKLPLCLRCKQAALARAINSPEAFCGTCHMGVVEWVVPVWTGGKPLCVLFVGNLRLAGTETASFNKPFRRSNPRYIHKRASRFGIGPQAVAAAFDACETVRMDQLEQYRVPGELVRHTIVNLTSQLQLTGIHGMGMTPPSSPVWRNTRHPVVLSILDHIDTDYAHVLSLRQFARLHFMDEAYLCRLIRKETGMTFSRHLIRVRLAVAKTLLQKTDLPVHEIAIRTGFTQTGYFIRRFRKETGQPPARWRSSQRDEASSPLHRPSSSALASQRGSGVMPTDRFASTSASSLKSRPL